ncbi:MAG: NAD-dependent epimerase/dehydratase family protein [Phycisphaerales bacterium]
MSISRREFVQSALVAGAAAAAGGIAPWGASGALRAQTETKKPVPGGGAGLNLLVLGGTSFIGPAFIEQAKAKGHRITVFNRGRTEKRKGSIDGIERLYGNRDPDKHAGTKWTAEGRETDDPSTPKGLAELVGKKFDAVLDTSGFYPRHVKAGVDLLAPNCGHYVFISTISVYADNNTQGQDERAAIATMEDPTVEEMRFYGPLKALCENEARRAFAGRCAIIRPGYIVGPNDNSDRFTYWPVRTARGGEVLAPGDGTDPMQVIDVRDLAAFCLTCIENKTTGDYNAVGPEKKMTMREVLDACKRAAANDAAFTWVPSEFLEANGVEEGALPIWIALGKGDYGAMHTWSNAAAVAKGLRFRAIEATCKDLIEWWPKEVERRGRVAKELAAEAEAQGGKGPTLPDATKLRAGIGEELEKTVLEKWAGERAKGK